MLLQKRNAGPEWVSDLPEVTQQGQSAVRVENQVSDYNVIRTLLHFNELLHDAGPHPLRTCLQGPEKGKGERN